MIIQHNIMSLNAHRQMGGNTNQVSKNLEKLSSGYKINRAGDDAAGLAISEKMRAQITGLTRAQSNAQDGISLVQTAEGALTEVHSMLNRMVDLATQSSNGTMQADDRQKIQDEMNALTEEIDRISKSTNFNGIDLLDGSLGSVGKFTTTEGTAGVPGVAPPAPTVKTDATAKTVAQTVAGAGGAKALYTMSLAGLELNEGGDLKFSLGGKDFTITVSDADKASPANIATALAAKINAASEKFGGTEVFTATATAGGEITLEAAAVGVDTSGLVGGTTFTYAGVAGAAGGGAAGTAGTTKVELSSQATAGSTITIGDKTYEFAANAGDALTDATNTRVVIGADMDASLIALQAAVAAAAPSNVTVAGVVDKSFTVTNNNAAGNIAAPEVTSAGGGLVLQIGDTADDFNKVTVSVADMGTKGLGIDAIVVGEQGVSAAAIKTIKDAVETVSVNRSAMGALQNRLEHTINNLGVATENMTAAESRIRDVDMAKEMAAFTKNNVLTQAAQAMLAQANQQPQQVLQLLR